MSWPAPFLGGGQLDGVMNYWLRAALRSCALDDAQMPVAQRALDRLAAEVPLPALLRSWTVLSSHDTPRLSDQVGFDEARARLWLAVQFAYPGTPLLYYGEEIGMTGGADPACRGAMVWDETQWQVDRLAFVRALVAHRRTLPALTDGRYVPLDGPSSLLAFARATSRPADTLICVANPGMRAVVAELPLPLPGIYDALPFTDVLGGAPAPNSEAGWLRLALEPNEVRWLMPRDDDPNGYRFWKSASL
jgi:glycosidase